MILTNIFKSKPSGLQTYPVLFLTIVLSFVLLVGSVEAGISKDKQQYFTGKLEGSVMAEQGLLNYSLPLNLPGGIHGIKPSLAINYQQGGNNGLLGLGFGLSGLSSISRCPASKKIEGYQGGVAFDDRDRFCLDGKRMIAVSSKSNNTTEYRLWSDPGYKIVASGSKNPGYTHWKVYTKSGFIMEYGIHENTKESANGKVFGWLLSRRTDRFGNQIRYQYQQRNGRALIDIITYSDVRIDFAYQSRPDQQVAFKLGKQIRLDQRMDGVKIFRQGDLLGEYRLVYKDVNSANSWSRYSQIHQIFYCDGDGKCLSPLTFSFEDDSYEAFSGVPLQNTLFPMDSVKNYVVGDLNHDGMNDMCYYNAGLYCALNQGGYNFSSPRKWTAALDASTWDATEKISTLSLIDINHDSWLDYCVVDDKGLFCGINQNGKKFVDNRYWSKAFNLSHAIRFVDVNQDNLSDYCAFKTDGVYCSFNNGHKMGSPFKLSGSDMVWQLEQVYKYRGYTYINDKYTQTITKSHAKMPQPHWLDINGDGYVDICGIKPDGAYHCALGNGIDSGGKPVFKSMKIWGKGFSLGNNSVTYKKGDTGAENITKQLNRTLRVADLNADGLIDICYRQGNDYMCRMNSGEAFNSPTSWFTMPSSERDMGGWQPLYEYSISLDDRDGDGLSDFCVVIADQFKCAYNVGNSFSNYGVVMTVFPDLDTIDKKKDKYTRPIKALFGLKTEFHIVSVSSIYGPFKQVPDLDQDGFPEDCYRSIEGLTCAFRQFRPLNLLKSITDSYDLKTEIDYAWLSDSEVYSPESNANQPLRDVYPQLNVVKSVTTDNGIGSRNKISFKYQGYKVHEEDGAIGFHLVRKTNETVGKTTITEKSLAGDFQGYPEKVTVLIGGKAVNETSYAYEKITSSHSERVRLKETKTRKYDLKGSLISSQLSLRSNFDQFDNARLVEETTTGADGSVFKKVVESTFWNDTKQWILAKPTHVVVKHHAPESDVITRVTSFSYDTQTGALLEETLEPEHMLRLINQFEYDGQGNRIKSTSKGLAGDARTSTAEFDAQGRLVKRTNALGHSETFEYHSLCGLPSKQTGPNGLSTTFEYDSLCRKIKETLPDEQVKEWFYEWSDGADAGVDYQNLNLPLGDRSVYMVTTKNNTGAWSKTYFDAVGREVRSVSLGSNGKRVMIDKVYNEKGQLAAATLPYFEGEFPGDNTNLVINKFDALGRTIEQRKPAQEGAIVTRFQYNGLDVIETGPQGYKKLTRSNVAGRTVFIQDNTKGIIRYYYDAIGNLVKSDSNGYIVRMGYDDFDNKIWIKDPSMGHWTYEYNAFKELIKQTDAKGQVTTMHYDALGRLVSRDEAEGQSTFEYDTAENGIGKPAKEQNSILAREYRYNQKGKPTQVTATIEGKEFVTHFDFDQAGRLKQVIHPDGITVKRSYDLAGRLATISVPKKEVWDYDYLQLEKSYNEVLRRIYELEAESVQYEEKAQKYIELSTKYREYANTYLKKSASLSTQAKRLANYAVGMERRAAAYQRQATKYRSMSNYYWRAFGNTTLKYVRTVGGRHYYRNTNCTKKNWKGHCKRRNSYHAYIPTWMVGKSRYCVKIFKSSFCYWGPQRHIHVGRTYGRWANAYQNAANSQRSVARQYRSQANQKVASANSYKRQATQFMATAESYARMAREQTDMLRAITNELEDQIKARDAIQEALDQRLQDDANVVLWSATSYDATGRLKGELYGNGLLTRREFDPKTGRLNRVTTGTGNNLLRDLRYTYDQRDNVLSRGDHLTGEHESFQYDSRDRIIGWKRWNGAKALTDNRIYAYDVRGNITYKSGAGEMTYDQANRLTSRIDEHGNQWHYSYDKNGNQIFGDQRTITWNSFNKASEIKHNGNAVSFLYDTGHKRLIKRTDKQTVFYVNSEYEHVQEVNQEGRNVVRNRHHIFVGNEVVATYERTLIDEKKQVDKMAYVHRDALGNVDTVTDNHGNIIVKRSFAPYGEELQIKAGKGELFQKSELRGYTGHEQVDELSLINMNARMYDPLTARFLSADSLIPEPGIAMAHNRYMYVLGNPMKYTDPDGHWVWFAVGAAIYITAQTSDDENIYRTGSMIGLAMMGGAAASGGMFVGGTGAAMANGAIIGFTTSYLSSGGDFHEGAKGGITGAFSGALAYEIGHGFGADWHWSAQAVAHGAAQGLITEARGGEFRNGFIGGAMGKAGGVAAGEIGGHGIEAIAARTVIVSTFAGLAAEATGGSFRDAALSAAMTHLFNEEARKTVDNTKEALDHYFNGDGESVTLGPNTRKAIMNSEDQLYREERIRRGVTTRLSGNYGVNVTSEIFHVGDTVVHYSTNCQGTTCSTTFTCQGDGFWDPLIDTDGFGPDGEVFGTPYRYEAFSWTIEFYNPYQSCTSNGCP